MSSPLPFSSTPKNPGAAGLPTAAAIEPLSDAEEARIFWRMRWHLLGTFVRQTLSRSRFRFGLIGVLSVLLAGGMFWLFLDGFQFLGTAISHAGTHDRIVQAVFGLFFAALMLMLAFSAGILLYSLLFRAGDVPLLLTTPVRIRRIFVYKFQEAILFSSWAFLLLGGPMLLAYGIEARAPWYYYLMLLPYLGAFAYIPASLGAVVCLLIVRRLPNSRVHALALAVVVALGATVWLGWSLTTGPSGELLTPTWFQQILLRVRFTEQRLLPSWWLSTGLLEAARGKWTESTLFLALMISNALFFRQLAVWTAGAMYRSAYSNLPDRRRARGPSRIAWLDRFLLLAIPLPRSMRLLLVKDLRLFRRDPLQWSQFLIFFGLLALYVLNIRRLSYDVHYVSWANMVSFLNLSVVGLILSTFTTRFIFPMVSVEGRRFWILGLLPVRRETILWSKFLLAVVGAVIPCTLLVLLSDLMLEVSPVIVASHQLTCVILCVGLAGIAVGLGARMPNLRESSPARIAAGFGGTLNLVLSAIYILLVVALTALPCHFYLVANHNPAARVLAEHADALGWLYLWMVLGTAASVVLGAVATVVPLRIGFRAFREMEF